MKHKLFAVFLVLSALVASAWFFVFRDSNNPQNEQKNQETSTVQPQEVTEPDPLEQFDKEAIDATVQQWSDAQTGQVSVVVMEPTSMQVISEHSPDQKYFAASLYKLFVAFEGYRALDTDEYSADEVYLAGQTRNECLDKMIRESDSPCGETWWAELGKQEITDTLAGYDIENTDMVGLSTTAKDAAIMMSLIWDSEFIASESRVQYLSSLAEQPDLYRRGLPSGFSENVTVYNKVGWNLTKEWHDSAIVQLEDGRAVVISVLTENVGMRNIADLGTRLEQVL